MQHPLIRISPIGDQWETLDPFLFCAHHVDAYPPGNACLEPAASLAGRRLGEDFEPRDGWRMYHGEQVPGFPVHPHRGFETVTAVLEGFIDHADSARGAGRYGSGDVQWMSAGRGQQHSEMFPMVYADKPNPLHAFQIWLNLPAAAKLSEPQYRMLWAEDIPERVTQYGEGQKTRVRIIAGTFQGADGLAPPPDSWAAAKAHRVRILLVSLDPGAALALEAFSDTLNRMVYFFSGETIGIADETIPVNHCVQLGGNTMGTITNGPRESQLLVLEGEPIGEPVVMRGPFVMNTAEALRQTLREYQETEFGGWPWDRPDPVHDVGPVRFARYGDGRVEQRGEPRTTEDPHTAIGR